MPSFDNLFRLKTRLDLAFEKDEYIYFNSGSHVQTVRMRYKSSQGSKRNSIKSIPPTNCYVITASEIDFTSRSGSFTLAWKERGEEN